MEPRAQLDNRRDPQDRWLPPKKVQSNIPYRFPGQEVPANVWLYHNGTVTVPWGDLDERQRMALSSRIRPYKTYSMYHARGVVWTVDYDATSSKVGDGKHENDEEDDDEDEDSESSSSTSEEDSWDTWAELSFGPANTGGYQSLSRVGRHAGQRRLLAQRRGQRWVHHLIPDRYHANIVSARDSRSGGLVGELPLLIGLAAMSLPIQRWVDLLPQTIVNHPNAMGSWRITQAQIDEYERGSQCKDPWSE